MNVRILIILAAAGGWIAGCGLLTAPASLPEAVAENDFFNLSGKVVDVHGKPLEGVIVTFHKIHHFWTPIRGSADVTSDRLLRVDQDYSFDERGASLALTFAKDGYDSVALTLDADHAKKVQTPDGTWPAIKGFPVVMQTNRTESADLARFNEVISYAQYPIADCIALPNLANDGRSGDVKYAGKDARDPTIFPPGTLYLTMEHEAPRPINARGDIDPRDLDIPHHISLHLPGAAGGKDTPGSGFIRIEPLIGFHPLTTSDLAPATGYQRELTIDRPRLKAMRAADDNNIMDAHEYFFFHAGNRYGKGAISWAGRGGPPRFQYELYIQPLADNRDLTLHKR